MCVLLKTSQTVGSIRFIFKKKLLIVQGNVYRITLNLPREIVSGKKYTLF